MKRQNKTPDPGGGQGKTSSEKKSQGCGIGRIICLSTLVACLAIGTAYFCQRYLQSLSEETAYIEARLGEEGMELFKGYDLNRDGFISIAEFEPMVQKLLSDELMVRYNLQYFH